MALLKQIAEIRAQLVAQPNDLRLLQRLGELLQRSGDDAGAGEAFFRVAEQYARDGFFLKAIALAKQCLRLNPRLSAVNEQLGRWHEQLQLTTEAVAYYQRALKQHRAAHSVDGVERVASRLVAIGAPLDPDGPRH